MGIFLGKKDIYLHFLSYFENCIFDVNRILNSTDHFVWRGIYFTFQHLFEFPRVDIINRKKFFSSVNLSYFQGILIFNFVFFQQNIFHNFNKIFFIHFTVCKGLKAQSPYKDLERQELIFFESLGFLTQVEWKFPVFPFLLCKKYKNLRELKNININEKIKFKSGGVL